MRLKVRAVELSEANGFVARLHRHHKPAVGHRFSLGAYSGDSLVGVVIVGRPTARHTDQRKTLEVTRLCTDGTHNACSMLYAAAARAGRALGYERIQTFILEGEPGSSLKGAGWQFVKVTEGGQWHHTGFNRGNLALFDGFTRNRTDQPTGPKQLWSLEL